MRTLDLKKSWMPVRLSRMIQILSQVEALGRNFALLAQELQEAVNSISMHLLVTKFACASSWEQELDQSYLGMIPPSRFIRAKRVEPTQHDYPSVFP